MYHIFHFVAGRTGRYTLIEKWRETERHLAPNENPVVSLNKWGQYASDVQLILQRTGPSVSERPTSDGQARVPERGYYRQSLPPLAKLRPSGTDRSLKRREPKRKSLTFTGGAKGLRDIFGKSRDAEGGLFSCFRAHSSLLLRASIMPLIVHILSAPSLFLPCQQSKNLSFHLSSSQTGPAAQCEPEPAQGWRCWSSLCTWESSQRAEPAGAAAERQTPGPGESSAGL